MLENHETSPVSKMQAAAMCYINVAWTGLRTDQNTNKQTKPCKPNGWTNYVWSQLLMNDLWLHLLQEVVSCFRQDDPQPVHHQHLWWCVPREALEECHLQEHHWLFLWCSEQGYQPPGHSSCDSNSSSLSHLYIQVTSRYPPAVTTIMT